MKPSITSLALGLGLVVALATPLTAQGKGPKHYQTSHQQATVVVREVHDHHGWTFVRLEDHGGDRIVYYRRGNRGRGKGLGPVESFVIRRVENRVVFVDVPDLLLVDIDVRLKL